MIGVAFWVGGQTVSTDVNGGNWFMNTNINFTPPLDNVFHKYAITGASTPSYRIKIVFDPNAQNAASIVEVWGGTTESPVLLTSKEWVTSAWDSWYPQSGGTSIRFSEVLYVKVKITNFSNSSNLNFTWTEEWMA